MMESGAEDDELGQQQRVHLVREIVVRRLGEPQ